MINQSVKLNPKLLDKDVEQVPSRMGFGEGLILAGDENQNVVGLCADLTGSTKMDGFAKKYPERYVQVGIGEQNLASLASGMAAIGKIPFITSYAMFSPGRNWEQVRTTICYNDRNVKIIGSHAGVSVGPDGATHQAIEDMAITRVIPKMVVICPCDTIEAKKATVVMSRTQSPTYLRLSREKTPVITSEETPFEIGKAEVFYEGKDVTVIACGQLVYQAIMAAKELEEHGVSVRVINCHTIKPLDQATILKAAEETKAIVTIEEHQMYGGLGSAVAEVVSQNFPVPMKIIGVEDRFGESGEQGELLDHFGLTTEAIKQAVTSVMRMKGK